MSAVRLINGDARLANEGKREARVNRMPTLRRSARLFPILLCGPRRFSWDHTHRAGRQAFHTTRPSGNPSARQQQEQRK
ncbi:hypothetical protein [Paraburkholderia ginsengisoli]|uniref:Uncharacterized protein n=1 Tax=Paraburkholderia ginsengisoli TaxID=311231 RepID=A0A7T4N4F1_9BURK|nr:hypothetical protein [Paraburkholderia ginsengisoli]QQC65067.1 hypothetical protein I6I06_06255 [Paraburkholderia ginsengisoli]